MSRAAQAGRVLVRRLTRFATGQALVLLYHRIADDGHDPQLMRVRSEHFAAHLSVIRSTCQPIGLPDLLRGIRRGRLPRRAVAITFDDGYVDNLSHALPLLRRGAIPATVFVSTGSIGGTFWWDEVERLVLRSRTPSTLSLRLHGTDRSWSFVGDGSDGRDAAPWDVTKPASMERQKAYMEICTGLRGLPEEERSEVMRMLSTWAESRTPAPDPRGMTADEIVRLAGSGLVDIGGHGVTHTSFTAMSLEDQRAEARMCGSRLRDIIGRPVEHFAFPFGTGADVSSDSQAAVRDAGFRSACVNIAGVAWVGTDQYRIPRLLIRDWTGAEFASRLDRWFHDG
jgi:peptidoglycan/xylan/chitin deacetylase (PgdA/CDA1 family)